MMESLAVGRLQSLTVFLVLRAGGIGRSSWPDVFGSMVEWQNGHMVGIMQSETI